MYRNRRTENQIEHHKFKFKFLLIIKYIIILFLVLWLSSANEPVQWAVIYYQSIIILLYYITIYYTNVISVFLL